MVSFSLGPLEQEVMACLWGERNVSVREVCKCLRRERKIAYTTVMTIMTRLTKKGYLERKRKGRAYVYSPKKTKKQAARAIVGRALNLLVEQFGEEAITAFNDEVGKISAKRRRKISFWFRKSK
ncbi:BlaI/MecI/CopY family transcriptional regulator [Patescibacteria group bacterium]|nr:BlaI/MecI/CopY family transcriptional regulator [Patescibacteria group bacterium]